MPSAQSRPRWWFLITPRWLAWHAFVFLAAWGMLWLGDWQFHRAVGGNALSWAYTFEWPVFTIFGVVFWVKTIRDEIRPAGAASEAGRELELPPGVAAGRRAAAAGGQADAAEADPDLDEYNAYLAKLATGWRARSRWEGFR